jgi:hypothetical protein
LIPTTGSRQRDAGFFLPAIRSGDGRRPAPAGQRTRRTER